MSKQLKFHKKVKVHFVFYICIIMDCISFHRELVLYTWICKAIYFYRLPMENWKELFFFIIFFSCLINSLRFFSLILFLFLRDLQTEWEYVQWHGATDRKTFFMLSALNIYVLMDIKTCYMLYLKWMILTRCLLSYIVPREHLGKHVQIVNKVIYLNIERYSLITASVCAYKLRNAR